MVNYDMQAFDSRGNVVGIVSTLTSTLTDRDGEKAELLKLTRWQMQVRSGKVYVRWINSGETGEYYYGVFSLSVKLVRADNATPTFSLDDLVSQLRYKINAFHSSVRTRSHHPSMVSRSDLKQEMQKIKAIYAFLVAMNGYRELPNDIEKEVFKCELIVEAMYTKK